jgi:BOP1NT (NUC169) domain.
MVHAIKMGWMKPREQKKQSQEPKFYMLWQTDEGVEHMRRIQNHIPAPKRHLPGHAESYNPPPEFLFDKREVIILSYGVCFLCVVLVIVIADNTEKLMLCNGGDCKTPLFHKDEAPATSPVSYNFTIETDLPTSPPMLTIKHQKQKGVI